MPKRLPFFNSLKSWRYYFLCAMVVALGLGLLSRLVYLQAVDKKFLMHQSNERAERTVSIHAARGIISSSNGLPLAVSIPMASIWINPKLFYPQYPQLIQLSYWLQINPKTIVQKINSHRRFEFLYLKRDIPMRVAKKIQALSLPGLFMQTEYKRFYPTGAVDAHVIGFTNLQNQGQAGLEYAFNPWLAGQDGKRQVLKDRYGHVIGTVKNIKKAVQGRPLVLALNQHLQFIAYQALKEAVMKFHAKAGSVVVLNPKTGEVLAMVNQPSFNPNLRPADTDGRYRNRAVTDMYEPGSVIKAFNVALALESGKYTPTTKINTSPGWMKVGKYIIRDDGLDHGVITLTKLLTVSSNIGAAKVMLSLDPNDYWDLLRRVGFGQRTASGYPGESAGRLRHRTQWRPSGIAALAYGYGIDVTALQLAHAYSVLANHGMKVPVTFLKQDKIPVGQQVIQPKVADEVVQMLKTVVEPGGTGTEAAVPGYQVAGKTGTAYIAGPHGYEKNHYEASFVGLAPADDPKFVIAVSIRDPQGEHFGGLVSAPVFSKVMAAALQMYNVKPRKTA